jgi:predicted dehydrogenase
MNNRSIKWGILGTKWISSELACAITESATSELIAIASRETERAYEFAIRHNVPRYYGNYHSLLQDPDIDVVYIGLPNHLHKNWMIECARAGKHMLCEKPFVVNYAEAQEVITYVKRYQVFCMEALMYRCHPFIQQLEALIASGIVGDISSINAIYHANITSEANKIASGAILSLGCYPISLIRLLLKSEPITMLAAGKLNPEQTHDHYATAILTFENNVIASVSTADNMDMYSQFTIFGNKGILNITSNPWLPGKTNKMTLLVEGQVKPLEFHADKSLFTYEVDMVAEHIINERLSPSAMAVSWEHSLGNVALLDEWSSLVRKNIKAEDMCREANKISALLL